MMNSTQRIEAALAAVPDVDTQLARFVRMDGVLAVVQFGEGDPVAIPAAGQYPPWPGDSVRIERRNGQLVMIGPAQPKSGTGRITTATTPKSIVDVAGVSYELQVLASYTPVVNDTVIIEWGTQTIIGKQAAPPPAVAPPPSGGGGGSTPFEYVFQALDSGSWNGTRFFTNDVYASDSNVGLWVTGYPVPNTLPDSATITSLEIYLNPKQSTGVAPILGVVDKHSLDGPPTFIDQIAIGTRTGWVQLPTACGEYAKTHLLGIGVNHGGYTIWAGTQSDAMSGALRIRGVN